MRRNLLSTARPIFSQYVCPSCWSHSLSNRHPAINRAFSSVQHLGQPSNSRGNDTFNLDEVVASLGQAHAGATKDRASSLSRLMEGLPLSSLNAISPDPPRHRMHVYCTKHNTHITVVTPEENVVLSLSAGNLGLRKGARGEYDAAYQLAAYALKTLRDKGELAKIQRIELVFRDFGPGRDAVTKALQSTEGRVIRNKFVAITDNTRLKQGGVRSPKPRRLG